MPTIMTEPQAHRKPITISAVQPTSFREEQRDLMQRRCRLVYSLGFLIGVSVHVFYIQMVGLDPELPTAFAPRINTIYNLYAISVGIAAALVFLKTWSLRALLAIDFALLTVDILLSHFIAVVFDLNAIPMFAISILLFLHAAAIPVTVAIQAGLGVIGVLGFATTAALGYVFIPEIQHHWQVIAGRDAFQATLIEGTFQLSIVAIVSVVITKALYHMRLSLHKAQRLGAYLIDKQIGRGGMGQVFVAQHALMCRPSAVKVLQAVPGEGEASLLRFEREVRLSATLTHPNTITVYDFGRTEEDTFYYAMEYLEGLNLEELVLRFGPVPPQRAVFILLQVCGSLAEAHANNVVHRDIKPSNMFLTRRGGIYDFAKVLDFGLAKRIIPDSDRRVTGTGFVLGTPHYIAPESVSGSEAIDGRADLYSLGGAAYWLLSGRPPFAGKTSMELMVQHVKASPKRVSEVTEYRITPELDDAVMKCLEKDPKDRFQSAGDLGEALRAIRFDDPWTTDKARDWWMLHLPEFGEPSTPPDAANPLTG
jgi:serine/threonine-protein kinase